MSVLVIGEHDGQALKPATHAAIRAARLLGNDIHVWLAGEGIDAVAQQAAMAAGVTQVHVCDSAIYGHGLAENLTPAIMSMAAQYTVIMAAATAFGKNILPRVAALLDVAMISEVTHILAPDTFVRPIYAGHLNATVQSSDAIKVLTVRAAAFPATDTNTSHTPAAILAQPVLADAGLSTWLSAEMAALDRPELSSARVVVSGGRALGSAEQFQAVLAPLASRLNAALGATRAAVDAGYAPNEYQVGQTGTIVAPELYIALGISGAVQHIAGIKDSRVIVAINHDPDATIFQWADYGWVCDLFTAVDELQSLLGGPAASAIPEEEKS